LTFLNFYSYHTNTKCKKLKIITILLDVKTDEFVGIAPQKMLDLMHSIPIENCSCCLNLTKHGAS
jgi:hypothetical protein